MSFWIFPNIVNSVFFFTKNSCLSKVWTAIDSLSILWKSDLSNKIKRDFFQAVAKSKLLYGCTTWMLTKRKEKKLNGNYTRILRDILNKSLKQHRTIQIRRTRHAGHFWRSKDEHISDILQWTSKHERLSVGRPAKSFINHFCANTGYGLEELLGATDDRDGWRESQGNPFCQYDLMMMMMIGFQEWWWW